MSVPSSSHHQERHARPSTTSTPAAELTLTANAKLQAQLLSESSPALAELMKEGKLSVVAGFFDIESGKVSMLS
jgi:carbonic anhydrase